MTVVTLTTGSLTNLSLDTLRYTFYHSGELKFPPKDTVVVFDRRRKEKEIFFEPNCTSLESALTDTMVVLDHRE